MATLPFPNGYYEKNIMRVFGIMRIKCYICKSKTEENGFCDMEI